MLDEADSDPNLSEKTNIYDTLSALFNFGVSLGEIIGPLSAGFFVSIVGFSNSCIIMLIIGVLLIIWYGTLRTNKTRNSRKMIELISYSIQSDVTTTEE